ncbi:MAG: ung [Chlamydiia bacterium]|nr:ung [Chlamydiia bacterium]
MLQSVLLPNFTIEPSWDAVLQTEYQKPYFVALSDFIKKQRDLGVKIFPLRGFVFNAFQKTPYDKVKVVIVGQDPYHGEGQAHGLSFSVQKGVRLPPSLKNIFKELQADLGISTPSHGCLEGWAEQGVLLLNTTLTVQEGSPLSHYKQGWEEFTDAVIKTLAQREDPIIFLLWGKNAIDKCRHLQDPAFSRHYILTAPHPSPFSAHTGFLGCRHFSKANELLKNLGKEPIDWNIK